jgi:hypothetical protein
VLLQLHWAARNHPLPELTAMVKLANEQIDKLVPHGPGIPNALSNASSMVLGDYAALPANLHSIPGIVGFVGSSYQNPFAGREVTTLGMVGFAGLESR